MIVGPLAAYLLIMGLFALSLTIVVQTAFWFLRITGRDIRIRSISLFPLTIHRITYHHEAKRTTDWSIDIVQVAFHIPAPWNPRFATVTVKDLAYVKGAAHALNVAATTLVFWFLPVFFRYTSGTIITMKIEGFVFDTVNSTTEVWWVKAIRRNVTETIFRGETIRLHDLKTKVWLYQPVAPTTSACDLDKGDPMDEEPLEEGQSEKLRDGDCLEDYSKKKYIRPGYSEQGEDDEGKDDGEGEEDGDLLNENTVKYREASEDTEARARIHGVHWLIHNHRNERMYTFGSVNAEFRRPWGAPPPLVESHAPAVEDKLESPPGSLVLKATDSRWTKLPRTYTSERYFKARTPIQLALSILSLPRYAKRMVTDPLSIIDVEATDAEITFREFRLRDAELFIHGLAAARARFAAINIINPRRRRERRRALGERYPSEPPRTYITVMDEQQPTASTSKLQDVTELAEVLVTDSSDQRTMIALNRPESKDYLSKLAEFSLQQLYGEPTTLQTQSHHLTSSLTSLTHTSYPTFLSLHRTTTALTSSLESLASSLSSLLDKSLPALEESATNWKDRTEEVLRQRGRAKVVLDQHDKIRDLLDIPLLIDACVRNGYFAEALSLAAHAKSLSASSSFQDKSPPLILQSVLSEVHTSVTQMLLSLLATLYDSNKKLPALWKAVNFLRKMDGFGPSSPFASQSSKSKIQVYLSTEDTTTSEEEISSEEQIALAFLIGRETCLKSTLETSGNDVARLTKDADRTLDDREKEDLARYLKSYIDAWREGAYDVITQFTTIFLERSSSTRTPSSAHTPVTPTSANQEQETLRLHSLITTYATHALNDHLLPVLSPALSKLSLSLLPSLLTQLTYCSTAFARVGVDFRSILSFMFADAILKVVTSDLRAVSTKWNTRLTKASGGPRPKDGSSHIRRQVAPPTQWIITATAAASPPAPASPQPHGPAHIPPQMLASYPPLAEHTNALLGVFNNLRMLAPVSILPDLVKVVDEVLADGGSDLLAYLQAFSGSLSLSMAVRDDDRDKRRREKKVAQSVGEVYFTTFVPFVRRALVEGVYGGSVEGAGECDGKLDNQIQQWDQLKTDFA